MQVFDVVFEEREVVNIDRGLEGYRVLVETLPVQQGGKRYVVAALPVHRAEYADDLSGIAPNRSESGIGGQSIPLHVIMLGRVPNERIADRGIGVDEEFVSQFEPLF